jgi:hypothetical protein
MDEFNLFICDSFNDDVRSQYTELKCRLIQKEMLSRLANTWKEQSQPNSSYYNISEFSLRH